MLPKSFGGKRLNLSKETWAEISKKALPLDQGFDESDYLLEEIEKYLADYVVGIRKEALGQRRDRQQRGQLELLDPGHFHGDERVVHPDADLDLLQFAGGLDRGLDARPGAGQLQLRDQHLGRHPGAQPFYDVTPGVLNDVRIAQPDTSISQGPTNLTLAAVTVGPGSYVLQIVGSSTVSTVQQAVVNPVPEPATLVSAAGAAAFGLMVLRRNRRRPA